MDDVLEVFISESRDALDEIETILLEQSKASASSIQENINSIFRFIHSIKGTASFLDLTSIVQVSHEAETLLDIIRKRCTGEAIGEDCKKIILKTVDTLRLLIDAIFQEGDEEESERNYREVIIELRQAIIEAKGDQPAKPVMIVLDDPLPENQESLSAGEQQVEFDMLVSPETTARYIQESQELLEKAEEALLAIAKQHDLGPRLIPEAFRNIHSFKGSCGFMQLNQFQALASLIEETLESLREGTSAVNDGLIKTLLNILDTIQQALHRLSAGCKEINNFDVLHELLRDELAYYGAGPIPTAPAHTQEAPKNDIQPSNQGKEQEEAASYGIKNEKRDIRVDINKLDSLIDLVGELVIAQSMVLINVSELTLEDENLERSVHHLNRITTNLQDVAMSVRMVPLATVFKKMVRLVYDLSKKSQKKVDIELIGEETEVDRNMIEQINDPLVHIIRNSVDHGIELPSDREKAGKSEEGRITIEARHEGSEVWIMVKDDGRGLDKTRILAKAKERGLVRDTAVLSDEQIFSMIFEPGFSTAEKVTDISGRGVGMDVVKRNLEKLKGSVIVQSQAGQGTDIILRIPLTLAIIDGMLVRVGNTSYTIPLLSIQESIKIDKQKITMTPDGGETVLIREEHIPIIRLYKYFDKNPERTEIKGSVLVICESEHQKMALLIDEILGQQQTVIKGLPGYLGNMRGISGCTIMGNGEISLIIDISSLARFAKENFNKM